MCGSDVQRQSSTLGYDRMDYGIGSFVAIQPVMVNSCNSSRSLYTHTLLRSRWSPSIANKHERANWRLAHVRARREVAVGEWGCSLIVGEQQTCSRREETGDSRCEARQVFSNYVLYEQSTFVYPTFVEWNVLAIRRNSGTPGHFTVSKCQLLSSWYLFICMYIQSNQPLIRFKNL